VIGVVLILAGIPPYLIARSYSRKQEYQADELAGTWVDPRHLACALEKMNLYDVFSDEKKTSRREEIVLFPELWIVPPKPKNLVEKVLIILSTHPPVCDRVRRLGGCRTVTSTIGILNRQRPIASTI